MLVDGTPTRFSNQGSRNLGVIHLDAREHGCCGEGAEAIAKRRALERGKTPAGRVGGIVMRRGTRPRTCRLCSSVDANSCVASNRGRGA